MNGETPPSAGSNSGRSLSLSLLITSTARSRDRMSCAWLVTASRSTVPRSPVSLVNVGTEKYVVAADHQHPRFAEIFRRDQHHHGKGNKRDRNRRAEILAAVAPERGAEHGKSKSASINEPRAGGRGDCGAKLMSRLLLTDSVRTSAGFVRTLHHSRLWFLSG